MIIDKEVKDFTRPDGSTGKQLLVSYVNADHQINFLRYEIPDDQMFIWRYTGKNGDGLSKHGADPIWRSYDDKYVKRQPVSELSETRINEILCSFGPQADLIYDMNMPVTWFCDIETNVTKKGFPKAEDADNEINTISLTRFPQTIIFARKNLPEESIKRIQEKISKYSPLTKDYKFEFRYYKDELTMMRAFIDFIRPIPAVAGWNFIGYDWLYIYNRCKKLRLDITMLSPSGTWKPFKLKNDAKHIKVNTPIPRHKIIYDYMIVYALYDQSVKVKENNTLDFVAEAVLGIKKVNHSMGFEEFYRDYYEDYVFYNAIDTILIELIDKKIKTSNMWFSLSSELKTDIYETFSTIKPTETVMSYFLYPENKVLPVKPKSNDEQSSYQGAFVWPSRPGVYKNIGGLDFASLYPSIMMQFSISPESLVQDKDLRDPATGRLREDFEKFLGPDECATISGAVFKNDKEYLIPKILRVYFAKRKDAKKMKKQAESEYEELKHIYEKRIAKAKS